MDENHFTVSSLTSVLKESIEKVFVNLVLEGEVSGCRPASTGHLYFTLKDPGACISAVMWRSQFYRLPFKPKDGDKVIVTGSLSVYEPRGTYQIVCSSMRLFGEGDILAKLEERKRAYEKAGFFDPSHKKPIPKKPARIAVITSPTGAALQDILQVTGRRASSVDLIILPAVVQGPDAARTIAARIKEVNDFYLADVMIVGRGGGSIEDLLPFSEDCVIRAIYESEIPVISAVGHEIDWALSDFVADLRAPTPSAAAELVCESQLDQKENCSKLKLAMTEAILGKVREVKLKTSVFSAQSIASQLSGRLMSGRLRLDLTVSSLEKEISNKTKAFRARANVLSGTLQALSPLAILSRGYSIVIDKNGKAVSSASTLDEKEKVKIQFAKGSALATIDEVKKDGI